MQLNLIPNYTPEREEMARLAMSFLYQEMYNRGVISTSMFDFGIPAVIQVLAAKDIGEAKINMEKLNKINI